MLQEARNRAGALESACFIQFNVSIVDPALVGRPITIVVKVKLENESLDLLDEMKKCFWTVRRFGSFITLLVILTSCW